MNWKHLNFHSEFLIHVSPTWLMVNYQTQNNCLGFSQLYSSILMTTRLFCILWIEILWITTLFVLYDFESILPRFVRRLPQLVNYWDIQWRNFAVPNYAPNRAYLAIVNNTRVQSHVFNKESSIGLFSRGTKVKSSDIR